MQINFIINRIYKHCMTVRDCSFNPLMFIMNEVQESLFCVQFREKSFGARWRNLDLKIFDVHLYVFPLIVFQDARVDKCRICAQFMEMKRHAIWHNFQRIIPQIKKSIIFLLYMKYQRSINLHIILVVLPPLTLVDAAQSSTPSSIIFINVTLFFATAETNLWLARRNRSNLFNFFLHCTFAADGNRNFNFSLAREFLKSGQRKIFFDTGAEKILNSNNYFLRVASVVIRFNNAC